MLTLQRGRWREQTPVELGTFLIARQLRRRIFLQESPRDNQAAVFVLPQQLESDKHISFVEINRTQHVGRANLGPNTRLVTNFIDDYSGAKSSLFDPRVGFISNGTIFRQE